jgi:hypothetical protein
MARLAVLKVACALASSVLLPKVVLPSRNVTVPVAVPEAGGLADTMAVNVTVCPHTAGCDELLIEVMLPPLFTTCGVDESVPLLLVKLPEPL